MPPAIRITAGTQICVVPLEDVAVLMQELRRLNPDAYPSAEPIATILDAATADDLGGDVKLEPLEEDALSRVLHGLAVSDDLTESLRCLWDAIRTESAT